MPYLCYLRAQYYAYIMNVSFNMKIWIVSVIVSFFASATIQNTYIYLLNDTG